MSVKWIFPNTYTLCTVWEEMCNRCSADERKAGGQRVSWDDMRRWKKSQERTGVQMSWPTLWWDFHPVLLCTFITIKFACFHLHKQYKDVFFYIFVDHKLGYNSLRSFTSYELIKHQPWKEMREAGMTFVAYHSVLCSIKSLDCSLESKRWMAWEVSRAEVRWGGKMWCYFPGQIEKVSSPARKSRLLFSDTTDKWEAHHHAGLSHTSSWGHSSGRNKMSYPYHE